MDTDEVPRIPEAVRGFPLVGRGVRSGVEKNNLCLFPRWIEEVLAAMS
jgi:hypothetical protein